MIYLKTAEDAPPGLLGRPLTARADAQLLRLSVKFAGLDDTNEIHVEHQEAAWALWQYCSQSATYVFGTTVGDAYADRVLNALLKAHPNGLDGTQIEISSDGTPTRRSWTLPSPYSLRRASPEPKNR